jgi:hypothetical protein
LLPSYRELAAIVRAVGSDVAKFEATVRARCALTRLSELLSARPLHPHSPAHGHRYHHQHYAQQLQLPPPSLLSAHQRSARARAAGSMSAASALQSTLVDLRASQLPSVWLFLERQLSEAKAVQLARALPDTVAVLRLERLHPAIVGGELCGLLSSGRLLKLALAAFEPQLGLDAVALLAEAVCSSHARLQCLDLWCARLSSLGVGGLGGGAGGRQCARVGQAALSWPLARVDPALRVPSTAATAVPACTYSYARVLVCACPLFTRSRPGLYAAHLHSPLLRALACVRSLVRVVCMRSPVCARVCSLAGHGQV